MVQGDGDDVVRGGGVLTGLGIRLNDGVPINLRGSLEMTAFLAIGDEIEIILGESHVRALRDQAAAALGDMVLIEAADDVIGDVYDAGAQARTAADLARRRAEAAESAGAWDQAGRAREAARLAIEAADRAQEAVRAASEAMDLAEEAADRARAFAN